MLSKMTSLHLVYMRVVLLQQKTSALRVSKHHQCYTNNAEFVTRP